MELSEQLKTAAATLAKGGLVAFPTETVYGLGADASNPAAVAFLYKTKQRPASHPSIVHLASVEQIEHWCRDIPDSAFVLAGLFWPGPLTLILKRAAHVLDEVTGGQDTVGVRVPAHPVAQALLREFKGGIAAPSANRFGRLSPTTAADVVAEFGNEVMVLDGGQCQVGIESTIIDLSSPVPRILRPGMILPDSLKVALGSLNTETGDTVRPRAPGSSAWHYAPDTPVKLLTCQQLDAELAELSRVGAKVGVLAFTKRPEAQDSIVMPRDARLYAHLLYRSLRELDAGDVDLILVEKPEFMEEAWLGVLDRLTRAAAKRPESEESYGT